MDGINCGCPPGSTGGGGTSGALTCTLCTAGTASTVAGSSCKPCAVGQFSAEGAAQCSPCGRGKFNGQMMAAKCRTCPSGTYSAAGATQCLVCGLRDISQSTVETANSDVGSTSPYGIDCEDGVVGAINVNGTVTGVLAGHWAGAPVDETNANVTRVWVCETPEACLGGADSRCRTGHEGVLCAGCLPGYTRSTGRLCVPFDADAQSVAIGAAVLSIAVLLCSALVGLSIALLCCRLARPPKAAIIPPWMETEKHASVPKAPTGTGAFDVWVHREADTLVSFRFGESVAQELRQFGIDARVEPADEAKKVARRTGSVGRYQEGVATREGLLMVEFGWHGLHQVIKVQKRFRAMMQQRRGLKESSPAGPPEDELDNAAVCLFCLSDNIFHDERSIDLIARAVRLGKQCELIVMPKAKCSCWFEVSTWASPGCPVRSASLPMHQDAASVVWQPPVTPNLPRIRLCKRPTIYGFH